MIVVALALACASPPGSPVHGVDPPIDDTSAPDTGDDTAPDGDDTTQDDTGCDDPATWYADEDSDGFGDPAGAAEACEQPAGTVSDATDCDDADASVFPGAREVCGDGVVNDCDGSEDAAAAACDGQVLPDEALAAFDFNASTHTQIRFAGVGDVDGDGFDDVALGWPNWSPVDPDTGDEIDYAGSLWVIRGSLMGVYEPDAAAWRIDGTQEMDWAGADIVGMGDLNGDGYDDFAVGAPDDDWRTTPSVYLVHGPVDAPFFDDSLELLAGSTDEGGLGAVLASHDDADADGVTDLLVSARCDGWVHLVSGGATETQTPGDDDIATFFVPYDETEGSRPYNESSRFGHSLESADLDGDGIADVVVGAPEPYAYLSGSDRDALGFVAVFQGPLTGEYQHDDADVTILGSGGDTEPLPGTTRLLTELGTGLATADLDHDGYADLVAGGPMRNIGDGDYEEGGAWVFLGPLDQPGYTLPDADLAILGDEDNDNLGGEMDAGQDLDGDGQGDLLIGVGRWENNGNNGTSWPSANRTAWVFLAPMGTGTVLAADADFRITGEEGTALGLQARIAGDTDGDGVSEVLVGDLAPNLYLFALPGARGY